MSSLNVSLVIAEFGAFDILVNMIRSYSSMIKQSNQSNLQAVVSHILLAIQAIS